MTKLKKIWFWFWISHFANLIIKKKIVIFADFEQKQIKHKTHLGETGYLYIYIFFFRFSFWIFFFFFQVQCLNFFFFQVQFLNFFKFFFQVQFLRIFFFQVQLLRILFFFRFSFWEYYLFSGSVFENKTDKQLSNHENKAAATLISNHKL